MCSFRAKKLVKKVTYTLLAALIISGPLFSSSIAKPNCVNAVNSLTVGAIKANKILSDEANIQAGSESGNLDYGQSPFEQWVTASGLNFGLIAKEGIIEKNSTFHVELLSRTKDENKYNEVLSGLDKDIQEKMEQNNIELFDIGVTKPDGSEYTSLSESADLYIEVPEGWDWREMQAVYLKMFETDEPLTKGYVSLSLGNELTDNIDDEVTHNFIRVPITHFNPYAIYDELTVWDYLENYAWAIGSAIILISVGIIVYRKHKSSKEVK